MIRIEKLINQAVEDQDLASLQRIQRAVQESGKFVQGDGEMAERLVVEDPNALWAQLGITAGPERAESLGLDFANVIASGIRLVEFRLDKARRPELETLVAEGDSWFLHQRLADTLDHLRNDFNVRSLAEAGDTVESMVRSKDDVLDVLREERPRVFLFSGGGNDLLGDGRVGRVVLDEVNNRAPSELINERVFHSFLAQLAQRYEELLRAILRHAPGVHVFAHGYDHVVKIAEGPWIWPHLSAKGYDEPRARAVIKVLLDRFNEVLEQLEQTHPNFTYVDMRGLVGSSPNAWHDAIHPKDAGFGRVARRFVDAIRAHRAERPASVRFVRSTSDRLSDRPTNVGLTTEAVVRAFAFEPLLTDFESVRQAAARAEREFPDEDQWLPFDKLTKRHIRDVLGLLRETERGTAPEPELVATRLNTRPANARTEGARDVLAVPSRVGGPGAGSEALIEAVNEALVGVSEIEPVQVLLQGYRAARSVGRVQVMSPQRVHVAHGSGFLVGPGLLLTNHHVLPNADTAARSFVIFDDEIALDGSLPHPQRFRLTPEIYLASSELDYAFVSVEAVNRDGTALSDYGFLPLIALSGKALTFEPVSIVQHPGGKPKAIAIRNSFVMGRVEDGIYYTTDTKGGSSGSPVLNREWQVVALHHRFVPHPTEPSGVLANRGVRISMIFQDLHKAQARGESMADRVARRMTTTSPASVIAQREGAPAMPTGADAAYDAGTGEAWIADGVYAGFSEAEFLTTVGREEEDGTESDIPLPEFLVQAATPDTAEALSLDPVRALARVGDRGYRFIVAHEVSSRANYEAKLRNPILPAGASGLTIGIGYDLGHQSRVGFRSHWKDVLPATDIHRLEACVGKTGAAARAALPKVQDVVIPFEAAVQVFERESLPRFFGKLNRHIRDDVLDALHPHCVGALVSLTYNRGASFQAEGGRFSEMRAIRSALNGGEPDKVPGLIRSMKRLWVGKPNLRGLLRRRDEEADLFQAGLEAGPPRGPFEVQSVADEGYDPTPDLDEESELAPDIPDVREVVARPLGPEDAAWVRVYSNNPDYRHLPETAQRKDFALTANLFEELIHLGHYQPHFTDADDLIVGIRGAKIRNGEDSVIRRARVDLVEQKPDHRGYRCVMAIYHRRSQTVSTFRASTVPNRGSVAACANHLNGLGGDLANLLPTGCYELCVGIHFGKKVRIPTVLRLGTGTGPDKALQVTTLRSKNDAIYGAKDVWDKCRPADNIHPGFAARTANFSSQGCLTLPGRFDHGVHTGVWGKFRETAGFNGDRHLGTRYDLILTSGMELAAIDAATGDPDALARLRRLAHGSQGDTVRALQARLGLSQDGVFGPETKKALVAHEHSVFDEVATGVYSVPLDDQTGFHIF